MYDTLYYITSDTIFISLQIGTAWTVIFSPFLSGSFLAGVITSLWYNLRRGIPRLMLIDGTGTLVFIMGLGIWQRSDEVELPQYYGWTDDLWLLLAAGFLIVSLAFSIIGAGTGRIITEIIDPNKQSNS
jgi:hypothetical protein